MPATEAGKSFIGALAILIAVVHLTSCISASTLPIEGSAPAAVAPGRDAPRSPEYYLSKSFSADQIKENLELTRHSILAQPSGILVATDPTWENDQLILHWKEKRLGEDVYEETDGIVNYVTIKTTYRLDPATGFFVSDKFTIGDCCSFINQIRGNVDGSHDTVSFKYGRRGVQSIAHVSLGKKLPGGTIEVVTFVLNGQGEWKVSNILRTDYLSDGRVRETSTPYKSTYATDQPTVLYLTPVSAEIFSGLGPMVKEREAEHQHQSDIESRARSDARWATFGAVVQGIGQATTDLAQEQRLEQVTRSELESTLAQIREQASRNAKPSSATLTNKSPGPKSPHKPRPPERRPDRGTTEFATLGNAQRISAPTPYSRKQMTVAQPSPQAAPTTAHYQTAAMAWCYKKPGSGAYLCSGPLQMMTIVGERSLDYALKLAGCPGGEGKAPALGASEKFNCGRMLTPNERLVGDQSPYPN